jgi:hypothetical protein
MSTEKLIGGITTMTITRQCHEKVFLIFKQNPITPSRILCILKLLNCRLSYLTHLPYLTVTNAPDPILNRISAILFSANMWNVLRIAKENRTVYEHLEMISNKIRKGWHRSNLDYRPCWERKNPLKQPTPAVSEKQRKRYSHNFLIRRFTSTQLNVFALAVHEKSDPHLECLYCLTVSTF